jgi:hypothetical protein
MDAGTVTLNVPPFTTEGKVKLPAVRVVLPMEKLFGSMIVPLNTPVK